MRNSDKAMMRVAIFDQADRVMARIQDETQREFIEYLRDRITDRILEGRSHDCDEYQALCRLERGP